MVGAPEAPDRPFVAQPTGKRSLLLTRRMFREQERVAKALRARAEHPVPGPAQVTFLDARLGDALPRRSRRRGRARGSACGRAKPGDHRGRSRHGQDVLHHATARGASGRPT